MLIDGIDFVEDSEITNLTVPVGTSFPPASTGEIFFKVDTQQFYIYSGTEWVEIAPQISYTPEDPANKDVANGYAGLGADGKLSASVIPSFAISDVFTAANQAAMLGLTTAEKGDICIRSDLSKTFVLAANDFSIISNWVEIISPNDVTSINGQQGAVVLDTDDIAEGIVNLYFTTGRARGAISAAAPIQYNSTPVAAALAATPISS